MSLGLAVVFWAAGCLGKVLFAAVPTGFPPLIWRSELGFVAVMAGWWRIHPTLIVGAPFWVAFTLAFLIEGVVAALVWIQVRRRRTPVDLQELTMMLRRLG